MSGNLALKIDDLDNVATIFANGMKKGMSVEIHDKKGHSETITLLDDIPYGHKIALCDLAPGDLIMKYGECIGTASHPIVPCTWRTIACATSLAQITLGITATRFLEPTPPFLRR